MAASSENAAANGPLEADATEDAYEVRQNSARGNAKRSRPDPAFAHMRGDRCVASFAGVKAINVTGDLDAARAPALADGIKGRANAGFARVIRNGKGHLNELSTRPDCRGGGIR